MILFLIISALAVTGLHSLVMRSIDTFNGYGDRNTTTEEWRNFERERLSV